MVRTEGELTSSQTHLSALHTPLSEHWFGHPALTTTTAAIKVSAVLVALPITAGCVPHDPERKIKIDRFFSHFSNLGGFLSFYCN